MSQQRNSVIITTTFYRDDREGSLRKELARAFFNEALASGYPVIAVDGSPDDSFRREMNSLGVQMHQETQHGLAASRREALSHAQKYANGPVDYIVWSEPEKVDFVRSIPLLEAIARQKSADIVVPARISMRSYPLHQQWSEKFANQRHTDYGYLDIHGKPIDTFFGPKLWRAELSPLFHHFADDSVARELADMRIELLRKKYGRDLTKEQIQTEYERAKTDLQKSDHMIQMPVCKAVLEGKAVVSAEINYTHPMKQTKFERENVSFYNAKRLWQLNALEEQFALVKRIHESQHNKA